MYLIPLLTAVLPMAADSLKNFNIEEAVVVASPKETSHIRTQPLSVSLFNDEILEHRGVGSMKDLAALAPNLHMPAHGRGVDARPDAANVAGRSDAAAVVGHIEVRSKG